MKKQSTADANQSTEALLKQREALKANMDKPEVGFFRAWWIGTKSLFIGTAAHIVTDSILHELFPPKDLQPVENIFKAMINGRLEPTRMVAGVILTGSFAVSARKMWSNRIALNRAESAKELAAVDALLEQRGALIPEQVGVNVHDAAALRAAHASGQAAGPLSAKVVDGKHAEQAASITV